MRGPRFVMTRAGSIPIRYSNAGSRVYRCVTCCDLIDHGDEL